MKMIIKKPCTHCLVKMRCMVDCEPYEKFKKNWEKGIYPGFFALSIPIPIIYIGFIEGIIGWYILLSYWLITAIASAILIKTNDRVKSLYKDPFAILFICLSVFLFTWLLFVFLLEPYTSKKMKG